MKQMYKAMPNSPITYLAEDIKADAGIIPVLDDSKLPPGPSLATLGQGEYSETIAYETKSNGELRGVTRGLEGNKRDWPKGTEIARYHTAYDHNSVVENIENHINGLFHIVESGKNANGNYIKFADGNMVCWIGNFRLSSLGVNDYYITDIWTFPQKYIEPPSVFPVGSTHYTTATFASLIVGYSATTETTVRINAWNRDREAIPKRDETKDVNVFAIGRWK